MTEVWRDVKGYEGVYQVSDLGRVKSLARMVHRKDARYGEKSDYWIPERIRKSGITRGGYLFVPLCKDGITINKRVNRLVAEAFVPGYSAEKPVHHLDGDVTNNRADNLMCLTDKEHHDTHPGRAVVGEKDGVTITFRSSAEAGRNGFDAANVSRCAKYAEYPDGHPKKRKYATHKGWTWRYARGE